MAKWSVTFSHFAGVPEYINAETSAELTTAVMLFAGERGIEKVEIEDFSDEVHFFFRDKKGKRRRLLCCQYEG